MSQEATATRTACGKLEQQFPPPKINVSPARLTSFGIGAEVPQLFEPTSILELGQTLSHLKAQGSHWRILGAGSNVLLPPTRAPYAILRLAGGFSAAFLCQDKHYRLEELSALQQGASFPGTQNLAQLSSAPEGDCSELLAFAACPMMGLSRRTVKHGLSGLEFSAGIPGTIGGGVAMNAGAHGSAIANCLSRVYFLNPESQLFTLEAEELCFGYRSSKLPADTCILAAHFVLSHAEPGEVAKERTRCLEYRKSTQPLHQPSAGSVFRNPEQGPAAAELLEQVGVKGLQRGGVAYSAMHANWLVRIAQSECPIQDSQHAGDLIKIAQNKVEARFGIRLIPEIQRW